MARRLHPDVRGLPSGRVAPCRRLGGSPPALLPGGAPSRRLVLRDGMMTISFVDQVEVTLRGTNLEPHNTDVLVVKLLLLAVSAVALLRSFRRVSGPRET